MKVAGGVEAVGQCFIKCHNGLLGGDQYKKINPVPPTSQSLPAALPCVSRACAKLKCGDWKRPVVLVELGVDEELLEAVL